MDKNMDSERAGQSNIIKTVYDECKDIISDKKRLRAFLSDFIPEDTKLINIICLSCDLQIPLEISKAEKIDNILMLRLARKMINGYGIEDNLAKMVVRMWVEALTNRDIACENEKALIHIIIQALKNSLWLTPDKEEYKILGSLVFKIPLDWECTLEDEKGFTYSPYKCKEIGLVMIKRYRLIPEDKDVNVDDIEYDELEEISKCADEMKKVFAKCNSVDKTIKNNGALLNGIQVVKGITMESNMYYFIKFGYLYNIIFTEQVNLSDTMIEYAKKFVDDIKWINEKSNEKYNYMMIEEIGYDFGIRSYNCLKRAGINTVGELLNMTQKELYNINNLGRIGASKIIEILNEKGLSLKADPDTNDILKRIENDDTKKCLFTDAHMILKSSEGYTVLGSQGIKPYSMKEVAENYIIREEDIGTVPLKFEKAFAPINEFTFRNFDHRILLYSYDNDLLRNIFSVFPHEKGDNSVLLYGYIDRDQGITFEVLAAVNLSNDNRPIYRDGCSDKSFKIRYNGIAGKLLNVQNNNEFMKYYYRIKDINQRYISPDEAVKMRDIDSLDPSRHLAFPDDIIVWFIEKGQKPEGIWVRINGYDGKYLTGELLDEPWRNYGYKKGDSIPFECVPFNKEMKAIAVIGQKE